jgi:hypothetical protein
MATLYPAPSQRAKYTIMGYLSISRSRLWQGTPRIIAFGSGHGGDMRPRYTGTLAPCLPRARPMTTHPSNRQPDDHVIRTRRRRCGQKGWQHCIRRQRRPRRQAHAVATLSNFQSESFTISPTRGEFRSTSLMDMGGLHLFPSHQSDIEILLCKELKPPPCAAKVVTCWSSPLQLASSTVQKLLYIYIK